MKRYSDRGLKITSLEKLKSLVARKVLVDTWQQMQQAHILTIASSLAYVTILSIVPLLAVSFAIFQAFGGMQNLYETLRPLVLANLAQGTGEEAIQFLHKFIDNSHASAFGLGGLIGLIFTSMTMLSNAEKAINRVWQTRPSRSLAHRIYAYWFFITLGPLALSVAVGAATSARLPLANLLPSGTGMFVLAIGLFFFIFKWVPHTRVKSQHAFTSAVLTSLLWSLARTGYGLYTKHVVTYNKIYGSLGAIPIILVWIYIVWVIVLGGAALTAVLQKHSDASSS